MNERILTELLESFWKLFMVGVKVTIPLTLATFTTGLLIAFFVALMQIAKVPIMKRLVRIYIWIIRCTPMIVQLFIVYFGLPTIGIKFNSFTSAWIVMSLSIGAYCSETVRAAIESVPIFWQAMIHVIVPQALRTAFPPLSNSLIGLVKDTSLAYNVALVEILATAQRIAARTYDYFWLYLEAGVIYLIFCSVLTVLQRKAETGKTVTDHGADQQLDQGHPEHIQNRIAQNGQVIQVFDCHAIAFQRRVDRDREYHGVNGVLPGKEGVRDDIDHRSDNDIADPDDHDQPEKTDHQVLHPVQGFIPLIGVGGRIPESLPGDFSVLCRMVCLHVLSPSSRQL